VNWPRSRQSSLNYTKIVDFLAGSSGIQPVLLSCANVAIFYNAALLSTLDQYDQAVDPEKAEEILCFYPSQGSISTSLAGMNFTMG